jgi:hypothetical protein
MQQNLDSKFQLLLEFIKSIKCEICSGFGHFPSKCGTKDRIDEMVKFIPDMREYWRNLKASKVNKETLKTVVENKVKLSKKKTKRANKFKAESTNLTNESTVLLEEGAELNEIWQLGLN